MMDTSLVDRVSDVIKECLDADLTICGVPCSVLEPWLLRIDRLIHGRVIAPNEGQAVAYCAGAWLGGGAGLTFMQNSGLGNAVNALTSLTDPFRIPVLSLIGWRGSPGVHDEPQHQLIGRISQSLLSLCNVQTFLPTYATTSATEVVRNVRSCLEDRRSCALLLPPINGGMSSRRVHGNAEAEYSATTSEQPRNPTRDPVLSIQRVLEVSCEEFDSKAIFVASTGFCARELYAIADASNKFYMVGSMGHAGALGLGIAVVSKLPVLILDGDGALLMHLGSLAMVGASRDLCLTHILLNNGMHESTGGQSVTGVGTVDFRTIAHSCGYINSWRCHDVDDLRTSLRRAHDSKGPSFIEVPVVSRPNSALPRIPACLPDFAMRIRSFITGLRRDVSEKREDRWKHALGQSRMPDISS